MFSQWFSCPQALVVGFPTFSLTERSGFAVFARNVLALSNSFLVFQIIAILCITTVVEGAVSRHSLVGFCVHMSANRSPIPLIYPNP